MEQQPLDAAGVLGGAIPVSVCLLVRCADEGHHACQGRSGCLQMLRRVVRAHASGLG